MDGNLPNPALSRLRLILEKDAVYPKTEASFNILEEELNGMIYAYPCLLMIIQAYACDFIWIPI